MINNGTYRKVYHMRRFLTRMLTKLWNMSRIS